MHAGIFQIQIREYWYTVNKFSFVRLYDKYTAIVTYYTQRPLADSEHNIVVRKKKRL